MAVPPPLSPRPWLPNPSGTFVARRAAEAPADLRLSGGWPYVSAFCPIEITCCSQQPKGCQQNHPATAPYSLKHISPDPFYVQEIFIHGAARPGLNMPPPPDRPTGSQLRISDCGLRISGPPDPQSANVRSAASKPRQFTDEKNMQSFIYTPA